MTPTEPTLFDTESGPEPLPVPGRRQRLAFTGGGKHWHGTVTRTSTRPDGTPRIHADIDGGGSVAYWLGPHFRLTRRGELCPECGKPDPGEPLYGRP